MDYRSPLVDRRSLADASLCPACGADLARRTTCAACGIDLTGEPGLRLWDLSRTAVATLDARVVLLDDLTRQAQARAAAARPAPVSAVAPPIPTAPAAPAASAVKTPQDAQLPTPWSATTQAGRGVAQPAVRQAAPVGVQRVLVTAGAFLVAVAVIGFLAFSWSVAGLGVRALIIAAVTSGVVWLAVFLRERLPSTAEAIASLSVVLLLCDVWAARATELPLADAPTLLAYIAVSLILVGAGLVVGAARSGLRAWSIAGGLLVVLGAASAGAAVVHETSLPDHWYTVLPAATGVVALFALHLALVRTGEDVARSARAAATVAYTVLLLPVVVTAAAQAVALLGLADNWWEATATTPLSDLSFLVWNGGSWDQWLATATGVTLAAATAWWPSGGPFAALSTPRSGSNPTSVTPPSPTSTTRPGAVRVGPVLRVLLGGLALAMWSIAPGSPVYATVAAFALIGVACAAVAADVVLGSVARRLSRRALVVVAIAATGALLLVAWTARPLSVPVTALVGLGILLARRAAHRHAIRAALASAAALAGLVAATVAPAWLGFPADGPVPFWPIVTTAAVLYCTVGPYFANRASVLATVLAVHLGWVLVEAIRAAEAAQSGGPEFGDTVAVAVVAWFSAVVVIALALRARAVVPGHAGSVLAAASALAVPPVLASAAADSAFVWTDSGSSLEAVLVAGSVLVVAVALAGLVIRFGPSRVGEGRVACEVGLVLTGASSVLQVGVDGALDGSGSGAADSLWLPLLLLGAAAAAIAATPERRWARWLSWTLLSLSWWARLGQADLAIEVYAVPPAVALLGLGLFDLVRRPSDTRFDGAVTARALGPALGLALLPSLWASTGGSPVRSIALMLTAMLLVLLTAMLLVLAGRLLMLGEWPASAPGQRLAAPICRLLLATGVALSLATAVVRSATHPQELVEWYALGAVATLAIVVASGLDLWPGLSRAVSARTSGLAGGSALTLTPRALAAQLALVAAAAPTLLAAAAGEETVVRAAVTEGITAVAVIGAAVVLLTRRIDDRAGLRDGLWSAAGVATAVCLAAAAVGVASPSYPVDVWTLPAGLALTALGATLFRRRPSVGSWGALGPGVVLTLAPSLFVAVASDGVFEDGPRALVLVAAATVTVVVGARLRLAAPFVLGVAALIWYGLHVLGPTLAALWRDAPVWLAVGLAGAVLLYVGATAERRLKDVAQARAKLAAMR